MQELICTCHISMALLLLKLEDFDTVFYHCQKALEVNPESAGAIFRRGQAYAALGDWGMAVADMETYVHRSYENIKSKVCHRDT